MSDTGRKLGLYFVQLRPASTSMVTWCGVADGQWVVASRRAAASKIKGIDGSIRGHVEPVLSRNQRLEVT
jgi:hypothetical protein